MSTFLACGTGLEREQGGRPSDRTEQGPGADCLQRLLLRRARFRQQLTGSIRLPIP